MQIVETAKIAKRIDQQASVDLRLGIGQIGSTFGERQAFAPVGIAGRRQPPFAARGIEREAEAETVGAGFARQRVAGKGAQDGVAVEFGQGAGRDTEAAAALAALRLAGQGRRHIAEDRSIVRGGDPCKLTGADQGPERARIDRVGLAFHRLEGDGAITF